MKGLIKIYDYTFSIKEYNLDEYWMNIEFLNFSGVKFIENKYAESKPYNPAKLNNGIALINDKIFSIFDIFIGEHIYKEDCGLVSIDFHFKSYGEINRQFDIFSNDHLNLLKSFNVVNKFNL